MIASQLHAPTPEHAEMAVRRVGQLAAMLDQAAGRYRDGVAAGRPPARVNVARSLSQIDGYLATPVEQDPFVRLPGPADWPGAEEWRNRLADAVGAARPDDRPGLCHLPDGSELYQELIEVAFHDSIPGHHLQLAIAAERTDLPAFQRLAHRHTAFVEGWGLYAERLADEMGLYEGDIDRLGMLGADAWRACRLVVDTGLHAMGWTRQQAIDFVAGRYIGMPGQALAYKVGQLARTDLVPPAQTPQGLREPRWVCASRPPAAVGRGGTFWPASEGGWVERRQVIDGLDVDLLRALRESPKVGVLELSRLLGVARGTVQSRLDRMERAGIITGYGPDVDVGAAGYPVQAFATLEIAQGALEQVAAELAALPAVLEAYATTGSSDVLCRLAASSHEDLQDTLLALNRSPTVARSTSVVVLSVVVAPRTLPLLESQPRTGPRRAPAYRDTPEAPA